MGKWGAIVFLEFILSNNYVFKSVFLGITILLILEKSNGIIYLTDSKFMLLIHLLFCTGM